MPGLDLILQAAGVTDESMEEFKETLSEDLAERIYQKLLTKGVRANGSPSPESE